ncbi:hypothetical protein D3C76_1534750 [compost metagenome]
MALLDIVLRKANQLQHGIYLLLLITLSQLRITFFCSLDKQLSCTIFCHVDTAPKLLRRAQHFTGRFLGNCRHCFTFINSRRSMKASMTANFSDAESLSVMHWFST